MRCKNCGWPNKPNEKTCVKCHTPLESNDADFNVSPAVAGNGEMAESAYGKTVREEDVFGRNNSNLAPVDGNGQEVASNRPCPKCGYPVRPGTEKCPNCKFPLNGNVQYSEETGTGNYRRTRMDDADNRKPTRLDTRRKSDGLPYSGTVNPYMMNLEMEPSFMLKPLKRINERHELEELEFEGREVALNRDNTEPGNPSITSQQQAVISKIDGRWFIEDKSGQKTTFVQAASKIELHEGDLILLGNRLFEFHE